MPAPTNIIGAARQQTVFAVKETMRGAMAFPAAAAPLIIPAGYVDLSQNPSFTNSEEIKNSRDVLAQFQDAMLAGTFSIPIYARPDGTAGSVPMGDVLFESLLGSKAVSGGSAVVYSPAMSKPSFSLFAKRGHTVFFALGAVAETLRLSAKNKGAVLFEVGGSFMQMGWAGRDAVKTTATADATSVQVYDAKKYTVGAVIWNATKADKGVNGYTVTAVNTITNTLTLSTGVGAGGWTQDDIIEGYLPAGTSVGAPLESRKTSLTIGGITKSIKELSLSYDDKVKMLDDEITTNGYPTDYAENNRSVTGSLSSYFRQNDMAQFMDSIAGSEQAISLIVGDTAGKKLQIDMPRCKLQVPKVSANAPTLDVSIDYTALGTEGEDSITLTWK